MRCIAFILAQSVRETTCFIGRCTVPVMVLVTSAIGRHRPLEIATFPAHRCRCPSVERTWHDTVGASTAWRSLARRGTGLPHSSRWAGPRWRSGPIPQTSPSGAM